MSKSLKSSHESNKKKYNKKYEISKKQEKINQMQRVSYLEKVSNSLNLPPDILAGAPIVTVTGRNEITVENYKGIIEYNHQMIKLQTKLCNVIVEGTNLNIMYFTEDEMKITGYVKTICYQ